MATRHEVQNTIIACSTPFKLKTPQTITVSARSKKGWLHIAHPFAARRRAFGAHIRLALCGRNVTSPPRLGKASP
jgi:hypothetical protein